MDDTKNTATSESEKVNQEIYDSLATALKTDINGFMYPRLPETVTLAEFEQITSQMYDLVMDSWKSNGYGP